MSKIAVYLLIGNFHGGLPHFPRNPAACSSRGMVVSAEQVLLDLHGCPGGESP